MIAKILQIGLLLCVCAVVTCAQQAHTAEGVSLRIAALKINVDDMDKALSFYGAKLGFAVADRSAYPQAVMLQTGDSFKLILSRVSRLQKTRTAETQVGLTLQVNDLAQTIAQMKALHIEFGETAPRKEAVGNAIFILDPFGRKISLMHQTIVKVEPFKEPKVYNFGVLIPDMTAGREFYASKLGFVVRSEKYLPLDLPLGYADGTFAFMLHYRPGVAAVKSEYPQAAPFLTMVFATTDLSQTVAELKGRGVKIRSTNSATQGTVVALADPFGNVSELIEERR